MAMQSEIGNKWSIISKRLGNNRSSESIRGRFRQLRRSAKRRCERSTAIPATKRARVTNSTIQEEKHEQLIESCLIEALNEVGNNQANHEILLSMLDEVQGADLGLEDDTDTNVEDVLSELDSLLTDLELPW